ncbi:MAG TPA: hypothetical protein VF370_02140 [Candidatus Cryosericum sp.]
MRGQVRRSLPPGLDPPPSRQYQMQRPSEQRKDAKHPSSQAHGDTDLLAG